MENTMKEMFDRTSAGKLRLTANNIYYWRAYYKKFPNDAANELMNFSFVENTTSYIATIYSRYIGMPELAFLRNDDSLESDISNCMYETTLNFMLTTNINRFSENSTRTLVGFVPALNCRLRHAATNILLNAAKLYLPNITKYALEIRILAYKGGIVDALDNHNMDEICSAIKHAHEDNHKKSLRKNPEAKEMSTAKNYRILKKAFDIGYEIKPIKKENDKAVRKAAGLIVDTYFNKDPMTRFVFYRFAIKAPLTSESKAVKHYFEKKGYSDDAAIDAAISEKKSEIRNFLKIYFSTKLTNSNIIAVATTKPFSSKEEEFDMNEKEIQFNNALADCVSFLNLEMMFN